MDCEFRFGCEIFGFGFDVVIPSFVIVSLDMMKYTLIKGKGYSSIYKYNVWLGFDLVIPDFSLVSMDMK